jgi:hypothetical protein
LRVGFALLIATLRCGDTYALALPTATRPVDIAPAEALKIPKQNQKKRKHNMRMLSCCNSSLSAFTPTESQLSLS